MPVGAHHQQIDREVCGTRQQYIPNREIGRGGVLDLGIDPMARQMPARCPQRDARHARAVLYAGRMTVPVLMSR
jgi:hypothetical protein